MTRRVLHVLGGLVEHGAELRVLELIRESSRRGSFEHHVFVLDASENTIQDQFVSAGATLHFARSLRSSGLDLLRTVRRCEIDIVHSHVDLINGWVMFWAHAAGVRVRISHMRSEAVATRGGRNRLLNRDGLLRRWISKHATGHVGVSPSALAAGLGPGDPREGVDARVILSGIDLSRLSVPATRLRGDVILVHVGRDTPVKNREFAVEVLAACRNAGMAATLYFIGETTADREEALRAQTYVPTEAIQFLGVRDDVPALVRGSDVLLSTSLAEGLPGSILEAALLGTPVLATDIPASVYLATLLGGIECLPLAASAATWVDAIQRAVGRERESLMPLERRDLADTFSVEAAVTHFEEFWTERLSG